MGEETEEEEEEENGREPVTQWTNDSQCVPAVLTLSTNRRAGGTTVSPQHNISHALSGRRRKINIDFVLGCFC